MEKSFLGNGGGGGKKKFDAGTREHFSLISFSSTLKIRGVDSKGGSMKVGGGETETKRKRVREGVAQTSQIKGNWFLP